MYIVSTDQTDEQENVFPNPPRFTQSFDRTNLQYSVVPKKPKKIATDVITLINSSFKGQSGIIYCLSRYGMDGRYGCKEESWCNVWWYGWKIWV